LIEAGCDTAQGFLYGRPVAEADMTALLLTNPGSKGAAIASPEPESTAASS
jgi:hypothetical protein